VLETLGKDPSIAHSRTSRHPVRMLSMSMLLLLLLLLLLMMMTMMNE
jgi:hypothetical protein